MSSSNSMNSDPEKVTDVYDATPTDKPFQEDALPENAEINDYLAKFLDMSENANENERHEKAMGLKEGLKTFPKAVFWSVVLSSTIIMEGYDTSLLSALFAFPRFAEKFGTYYPDKGEWQIPTKWQTSLNLSINVGEIIGLFIAGIVADRIGYRTTLITCNLLCIGLIFIVFFSETLPVLLVGQILLGMPWGAFQTLSVSYASEVCPLTLRIYLTTFVNICWVIGQLISSCVLKGTLQIDGDNGYKIPFALQWIFPLPIAIGIFFAPESPWWLIKKEQESLQSVGYLKTSLVQH
ncbi:unnamed protein product [Ambrosiozyma monospora]|uniref:Unnamed protein product n=1 Tax=Ambrosiozyma monospora TaxID=43982 RepID=A0ACB5T8H7_AMBMO|nr:unnamed protein product [Ambrosiozyma monospora]